jgi:hypothetical protein
MSDLDEAIRAHLALKRLHGADPAEVAELEKDAFGAVSRELHYEDDREPAGYTELAVAHPGTGPARGDLAADQ